jgi:hypothetical protein
MGFSSGVLSIICFVLFEFRIKPWALIISEQTNPHPASFAINRKGKFVIPAKGAITVLLVNSRVPIRMMVFSWDLTITDLFFRSIPGLEQKEFFFKTDYLYWVHRFLNTRQFCFSFGLA